MFVVWYDISISQGMWKRMVVDMTILIDNTKAVEITLREWDCDSLGYGPDWSNDFFEVGALKSVDGLDDAYWVDDVDYCVEQANDMVAGDGDFAVDGPQPCQCVDVTVLDRGELLDF